MAAMRLVDKLMPMVEGTWRAPRCSAGGTSTSIAALALRSLGQMSLLYASRMKVSASSKWILSRSCPLPCAAHAETDAAA